MRNFFSLSLPRSRQILLPFICILIGCASAHAGQDAERQANDIAEACSKTWEAATPTSACILEAEAKLGKSLESTYEKIVRPGDARAQKIRESQRAWLKYQVTSCELEAQRAKDDGPGFVSLTRANCLLLTTLKRVDELKALAEPGQ